MMLWYHYVLLHVQRFRNAKQWNTFMHHIVLLTSFLLLYIELSIFCHLLISENKIRIDMLILTLTILPRLFFGMKTLDLNSSDVDE